MLNLGKEILGVNYLLKGQNSVTGILEIIKTIFIWFLIVYAAVTLKNDAKNLVLGTMEIILKIVETVTTDPIKVKNPENMKVGLENLVNNVNEDKKTGNITNNKANKKSKKRRIYGKI